MNRNILFVIIGAVILCFMGLDNKYPFLTLDSGIYINSGFSKEVPADRSILYGIFVAHASWGKSLWLVIFTQALLLALILFYYFRYFSQNAKYPIYYLAGIFFISFCTSASVTTSTIYPGIFGSISILTTGLLLFATNLTDRDFTIILVTAIISLAMDISYLSIVLVVLLIYGILAISHKKESQIIESNIKRLLLAFSCVVGGFILICITHYTMGAGFQPVKDKQMMLMARLAGSDETEQYLRSHCPKKGYNLCAYRSDLKDILTSNGRISPAFHNSGYKAEIHKITGSLVSQQNLAKNLAKRTIRDFFHMITHLKIPTYKKIGDDSFTVEAINSYYNEVRESIIGGGQVRKQLSFKYLTVLQITVILTFLPAIIFIFLLKKTTSFTNIAGFILLSIFIYLLAGAFFYGSQTSIPAQVIWLLPLPVFLYLSDKDIIFRNWKLNEPLSKA